MRTVDNRKAFKPQSGEVPTDPGVYRFSDRHGRVLYIGKAKNLRNRLANYFQPLHTLQPRTQLMVQLAAKVDWTVVASDTESLVLEHSWINEFRPPFNVQFKDDKSYPYLVVLMGDEAPRAIISRKEGIKKAKYFGPYPKVWALRETLDLVQQAFPLRTCNDADYSRAMRSGRPCLASQIGRCHGPCSMRVSIAEHRERAKEMVRFLRSLDRRFVRQVESQMRDAAAAQRFEEAAKLRDRLQALEHILEKQAVVFASEVNADFFGYYANELLGAVHQFKVRAGRIRGERSWIVEVGPDDSAGTVLEQVLQSVYEREAPPKRIITSALPENAADLSEVLKQRHGLRALPQIKVAERGEKARLLESAVKNAGEHLLRNSLRRTNDITARTDALAELQQYLGLAEPPLRIEAIDVSHLQGTNVVASLVVFEDGLPAKGAYRKYKVVEANNDVDSIRQVVARRAAALGKADELAPEVGLYRARPQLLLIDGGQPQVAAAAAALEEAGITDIAVAGIAKRLEELWLPEDDFPVILPRNSEALFLVQRLRDEAHRFAITFQKQRRSKALATELSEIPGVGQARVKALLRTFGSVKRVRSASIAELGAVPGVGESLASVIYEHLHTPSAKAKGLDSIDTAGSENDEVGQ
ncbi:excinuclease ABC subunit UvrC [Canibacter zhoujuaniae]|uniref:excinuclease ABC subunit UvrC n=1 Tax=Canibacter zhoujuaniae TaxID=2708343 RepID=UPI001423C136|nr:excinuclease ABC subunit UvrC [Canibacter zhoujuaniae]